VRVERRLRESERLPRGVRSLQQISREIGVLSGWCVECTAGAKVAGFAELKVAFLLCAQRQPSVQAGALTFRDERVPGTAKLGW